MLKSICALSGAFLFLVFGTGCASVSTLQTGRVLKKGEDYHSVGLAMYSSDDFIGGESISLPLVEYTYRRGFAEKLDFGVRLTLIGSAVADVKYNLINGENFALATGLGVGYLSFTSTFSGQETKSNIIDFIAPLYLSYDLSSLFTVYGAGKYMYRLITTDAEDSSSSGGSLVSSSLGVKWGEKAGVFLEGSYIAGLDSDFTGLQYNLAYFFRF